MKTYPCFGVVIRRLRMERGLSQEELANCMNMYSHAHLSRLESGHKQPTLDMVFRLADALGVKAWELIKMVEEQKLI